MRRSGRDSGRRSCCARDALAITLDRARARGELPAGVPAGTLADVVFGVLWSRVLVTREPLDDRLADELVTLLAGSR